MIDLKGKQFGRYTAVSPIRFTNPLKWVCECSCGSKRTVLGQNLRRGVSQSCGCLRREKMSEIKTINLLGKKFGRLRVLGRHGKEHGRVRWKCLCDCGRLTVISSGSLVTGQTKSCGCLRRELLVASARPEREAALFARAARIRMCAKWRGMDCDIPQAELVILLDNPCTYCGRPESPKFPIGIDRVDSSKGYLKRNCAPCCRICNFAKSNLSLDNFLDWLEHVSKQPDPRSRVLAALHDLLRGEV
jgi:hypothetical protein